MPPRQTFPAFRTAPGKNAIAPPPYSQKGFCSRGDPFSIEKQQTLNTDRTLRSWKLAWLDTGLRGRQDRYRKAETWQWLVLHAQFPVLRSAHLFFVVLVRHFHFKWRFVSHERENVCHSGWLHFELGRSGCLLPRGAEAKQKKWRRLVQTGSLEFKVEKKKPEKKTRKNDGKRLLSFIHWKFPQKKVHWKFQWKFP